MSVGIARRHAYIRQGGSPSPLVYPQVGAARRYRFNGTTWDPLDHVGDLFARRVVLDPAQSKYVLPGTTQGFIVEDAEYQALGVQTTAWFEYTVPADGQYYFNTADSSIDTILAWYMASKANPGLRDLSLQSYDDDAGTVLGSGSNIFNSQVTTATLTAGQVVYLQAGGKNGDYGELHLNYGPWTEPALPGDLFADRVVLDPAASTYTLPNTTAGYGVEPDEPVSQLSNHIAATIWFQYTAPVSGDYSIDTFGSSIDSILTWFTAATSAPGLVDLIFQDQNDDAASVPAGVNSYNSQLTATLTAGQEIYIEVGGHNGDTGTLTINYSLLRAAVEPGAPTDVTAIGHDGYAQVSWTAPADNGGSPVTNYYVETFAGATRVRFEGVPNANTTWTVTSLTNGTAYTFAVRAVNDVGTGPASAPSAPVTPGP